MVRILLLLSALVVAGCQTPAPPPGPAATATPTPLTADYRPDSKLITLAQQQREWENHWNGVPLLQYPNDLLLYQNLLYELHPDALIETGTWYGGLTLYLATLLEGFGDPAPIVTVDIDASRWNELMASVKSGKMKLKKSLLDRVTFIEGSSVAPETIKKIDGLLKGKKNVLVLLDALHTKDHVLAELRLYSKYIPVGGVIIVTDTHLDGTEFMDPAGAPGPRAAVEAFLAENKDFAVYQPAKRYMVSAVHGGFLKRIR